MKANVRNEAATACKLCSWVVKLLGALGHFLSWKALIFHADCVMKFNWLLWCVVSEAQYLFKRADWC